MTEEQLVEAVALAIAAKDGLNFDEVCGYETGADECDSGTCIAALCEDHDPDWSRGVYRGYAKAAIRAIAPMILDMAADAANSQTDYASVTPFVHRERVESVSQPPSSPSMRSSMDREKLVERLNAAADDPMWADHAEVPKITLRKAAARITELETELAAAQHQVKGALVMYDALVVKLEAKEAELAAMKARGDRLAEALEECLREHGGYMIKGRCEHNARQALTEWRDHHHGGNDADT